VSSASCFLRAWGPASGNPGADCLGVINDAADFALWLSLHILVNTGRVLATVLKMPEDEIDRGLCTRCLPGTRSTPRRW
jgi:hypothetical protein